MEKDKNLIYANPFKRSTAILIDIAITTFLRIIVAEIVGRLWFNQQILNFLAEFEEKFGTKIITRNQAQIDFFINHPIFKSTLLFYFIILLVGTFYHSLFNSSSWMATPGKKLMKIMLIKEGGRKISFFEALIHYSLSLIPWIFMIYLISFQTYNNLTIYQAIVGNYVNLVCGLIVLAWIEIHLITKKKTTAHDMICKTVMVNGTAGSKFPEFKLFAK